MLPGGRSDVSAKLATLPEKYRNLGLAFKPSDVL